MGYRKMSDLWRRSGRLTAMKVQDKVDCHKIRIPFMRATERLRIAGNYRQSRSGDCFYRRLHLCGSEELQAAW